MPDFTHPNFKILTGTDDMSNGNFKYVLVDKQQHHILLR